MSNPKILHLTVELRDAAYYIILYYTIYYITPVEFTGAVKYVSHRKWVKTVYMKFTCV